MKRKIADNKSTSKRVLSILSKDKNIRDMTHKGYTVIYEVNFDKNTIEILQIFNRNKP